MPGWTKKTLSRFKHVPTWVFLVLFLVSASVTITALRHNNQQMIVLRSAVYTADKNNGDVNTALNNLRAYVYAHMNTNLSSGGNAIKPPIQLKYTYERLQSTGKAQADTTNAQMYTDAQTYCQVQNPVSFSGRTRVPCVQDYVTSHGVQATTVPTALYQFDFISPTWSPDLAGWSLLITVILFIIYIISFSVDRLVRSKMRHL